MSGCRRAVCEAKLLCSHKTHHTPTNQIILGQLQVLTCMREDEKYNKLTVKLHLLVVVNSQTPQFYLNLSIISACCEYHLI